MSNSNRFSVGCKEMTWPLKNERTVLLQEIAELILKARSLNLSDTAYLLNIAHLELKARVHGISSNELQAFTDHVRAQTERI